MKKKKYLYVLVPLIAVVLFFLPLKFTYTVYSTGKIFPVNEWILGRTPDGRITETMKNNQLGVISSYGGKEFQRGDVFDFSLDPSLYQKQYISKGENIGALYSNDLERQIVALEGEKDIEVAMLKVHATGQKPETVKEAEANLILAREKFEIQRKLIERKAQLFKDSLISPQEYDLAMNEYQVIKNNYSLAQAQLEVVKTGEKPEQIKLSKERIQSLENQIKNLKERKEALSIKAPFAGLLQHKKGGSELLEVLANIVDTANYIIITPIKLKEMKYVAVGQTAKLSTFHSDCQMEARIIHIDNAIQIIGGKQAVYITARVEKKCPETLPGVLAQTVVQCGELTIAEYAMRLLTSLFYR
ncbi:MAG: HlyD family secretion protein [Cytophagaceae bacterium]